MARARSATCAMRVSSPGGFRRGGGRSSLGTVLPANYAREHQRITGRRFHDIPPFIFGNFSQRALGDEGSGLGECNVYRRGILIAVLDPQPMPAAGPDQDPRSFQLASLQ